MKSHLKKQEHELKLLKRTLEKDPVLLNDIDFKLPFIPHFSNAKTPQDIKLVIIGQDPTVRNEESRKQISVTLNLDKEDSLKKYIQSICDHLSIDLNTEVYATNLYKCFFKFPPADDTSILSRQFKHWMDHLINELKAFNNPIIVTLGEPVLQQLLHCNENKVRSYWDYTENTESGLDFKFVDPSDNYLQKRIYPLPHQPSWSQNKFYHKYLTAYLDFIKQSS